jgi:hypothetical protein
VSTKPLFGRSIALKTYLVLQFISDGAKILVLYFWVYYWTEPFYFVFVELLSNFWRRNHLAISGCVSWMRMDAAYGRKEGRMYYCGGPTKEQAGSVPTYNTSRLYATDINGSFAVKTYLP